MRLGVLLLVLLLPTFGFDGSDRSGRVRHFWGPPEPRTGLPVRFSLHAEPWTGPGSGSARFRSEPRFRTGLWHHYFRYVTFFRSHTSIVVALLGARSNVFLSWQDGWHTEDLLRPVFMGCATKNAKVITIALGSL